MQHMRVELSFDTALKLVKGRVTHVFRCHFAGCRFDFFQRAGIRILDASLNGKKLRFNVSGEGVTATSGPAPGVGYGGQHTFTYEANPDRDFYFIGWDDPAG